MSASCHDGATGDPGLTSAPRVALIGAPNAGKTTLFNQLTGLRAKTANYPGVTVTRRTGTAVVDDATVIIDDLPGTYSLVPVSPDEEVVADALAGRLAGVPAPDAILVVADATTMSRSLILVAQALQLGLPACVVITMTDELQERGGRLDIIRLQSILGVPVVGVVGTKGIGVHTVRDLLVAPATWPIPALRPPADLAQRSAWIDSVLESVLFQAPREHAWTRRIDRILLHPVAGVVIFIGVMVAFFQIIFSWAVPAQDAIEAALSWLSAEVAQRVAWEPLASLLTDGVIGGVGTVLTFIPQIFLLFLVISFLENVGYMSRAAFVMDRVMGSIGLEGRSFVSLLSSYACAIPGIMSTRTIPSSRDRIATILVAPLMTCSARLPVYTLLISAFVPNDQVWGPLYLQGLVLLGLYLLGSVSALLIAGLLKRTALRANAAPFFLEIPPYRVPGWKLVLHQVWDAIRFFLRKAGTVILLASVVLWGLLHVPVVTPPAGLSQSEATSYQLEHSVAGSIGRAVEPVFAPLGFNWEINVGLIASLSAREVFVSTMGQITAAEGDDQESVAAQLQSQTNPDGTPVFTPGTVAALLVFFVFALQCISTVVVMRRETNSRRWPAIAFGYMFALAWVLGWVANVTVTALT